MGLKQTCIDTSLLLKMSVVASVHGTLLGFQDLLISGQQSSGFYRIDARASAIRKRQERRKSEAGDSTCLMPQDEHFLQPSCVNVPTLNFLK